LRKNCLLKHAIEGKIEWGIEVTGKRGRRRKQILDDYGNKKILEIERGSNRLHCVDNCGHVVGQNTE
jgi:hypothetical protein